MNLAQIKQDRANGVVLGSLTVDWLVSHAEQQEAALRANAQALADSNLALMEQTELAEKLRKQAEALEAELRVARAACDAQGELSDTYRGIALAATPPAIEAPLALSDDALNGQYFGKLLSRLVAFGFSGGHDNALIEYVRNYGEAKRALGRCDAVREYIESGMFEPATAPAVEDSRANGNVAPAVQSQPALAWMHTLADGIFGDEGWNVQFLRSQKEADEQLRIHGGSVTPLAALPSQPAPEAAQAQPVTDAAPVAWQYRAKSKHLMQNRGNDWVLCTKAVYESYKADLSVHGVDWEVRELGVIQAAIRALAAKPAEGGK